MPIPDYQELMLPLLKFAHDGKEHKLSEAVSFLSNELRLSEYERAQKIPSGKQSIVTNRIGWSKMYLKKAGLIKMTRRGYFIITNRGQLFLKNNPDYIGNKALMVIPEFEKFLKRSIK